MLSLVLAEVLADVLALVEALIEALVDALVPVSYTHLDVYKRQPSISGNVGSSLCI